MRILGVPDPAQEGVSTYTFASVSAWLQVLLVYAISIGARIAEKGMKTTFFPDDVMILSEKELSNRRCGAKNEKQT